MPRFPLHVMIPGIRECLEHEPHDHPTEGFSCSRCLAVLQQYQPSHDLCYTHHQHVVRNVRVCLLHPADERDGMAPSRVEATMAAYHLAESEARSRLAENECSPVSLAIARNGTLEAWEDERHQWRKPATADARNGRRVDLVLYELVFAR